MQIRIFTDYIMRQKNINQRKLKILFIIRSAEHFLRYDSIVSALCSAGHSVTVLFDKEWSKPKDLEPVEEFRRKFQGLSYGWLFNRNDFKARILFVSRSLLTYRRYLLIKEQSKFFGDRWRRYLPFWLRIPVGLPLVKSLIKTAWCGEILRKAENYIPPAKKVINQIKDYKPDVLISPVGGIRVLSPNTEYLKAATALGIPTAAPTISWDSLTTKALITVFPDVFLLWNEFHKQRALEHHQVSEDRIRIIGAPVFDRWFANLKPSQKPEFYRRAGLKIDKPYILYLGSAAGTAKNETWLITEIRKAIDNSAHASLRNLEIAVRPHPSNTKVYKNFSMPGIVLMPKGNAEPMVELQRSFDTYYYAAAVVGIFTSAMMEAQIMDKPVIAILSDHYKETQMATQHFQDFIKGDSLELAADLDELKSALTAILSGRDKRKIKRREFVVNYIRPLGIGQSAGQAAVQAIEQLVRDKSTISK